MNELELFAAAIAIPNPADRDAFLRRECNGRSELRQRLDQLLAAHARSLPILDPPIREVLTVPLDYDPNPYNVAPNGLRFEAGKLVLEHPLWTRVLDGTPGAEPKQ
jgi:hypothetical protein